MNRKETLINDFATRSFRNFADRDYISARMNYRAGLISQFQWAAHQAIEKYYKAILLYNRVKATDIGHKLKAAQRHAKRLPFEISLSPTSQKLIDHLDSMAVNRYLEHSYFTHGPKLLELDRTIWELRRYCKVINYQFQVDGKLIENMPFELQKIEKSNSRPPQEFRIVGGALEKIIDNKNHLARDALIWQNGFFGKSRRKTIRVGRYMFAENSPLYLNPEITEEVTKYIFLPKELRAAYIEYARAKAARRKNAD